MTTTVHNTWISWLRSTPDLLDPELLEDYPDLAGEDRFERILELNSQKLKIEALKEAIKQLTPRQRAVVVLHEMSGLSTQQVAEALDISESTVRVHLCKGKQKLARLLAISDQNGERGRQ
jgi:RNA polymerase sigma-70 factor, ECF subfamily